MRNNQSKESGRHIESVTKALDILCCFTIEEPKLTLKQLSIKTGLYKSRISRLCGTLSASGFLIIEPGPLFKLGPRLMALGNLYERTNPLSSLAEPILRELVSLTSETAELYIIAGLKRTCIAVEECPSSIRYVMKKGRSLEMHAGAAGKLLLAYSSESFRNHVLNVKVLEKFTEQTIVERDLLEMEFKKIRRHGYAISRAERFPEVAAIAAPVFNHEDLAIAALSLSCPEYRFTEKHRIQIIECLLSLSKKLSILLGKNKNRGSPSTGTGQKA